MRKSVVERARSRVAALPRPVKATIAIAVDASAMLLLLFAAVLLRRGSLEAAMSVTPWFYVSGAVISVLVLAAFKMYRAVFRFISRDALYAAGAAVVVAGVILMAVDAALIGSGVTIRAYIIFAALGLIYMAVSRIVVRDTFRSRHAERERVVIYGAGAAGAQLVRSLREGGQYIPVAFIDSDRTLQGRTVSGIRIYAAERLPLIIEKRQVTSVLLAVPSINRRQRHEILKSLEPLPVSVRTVPDIGDIVAGKATFADVTEVGANDLLGRDPVPPNEALLHACIRGKVVLVTGAGGSIGSELCRQIIKHAPRSLLLLEMSEPALYQIERELRLIGASSGVGTDVVPLLGSAHHRNRMREIMQRFGVQTVYHAAAYKHVPIVEQNIIEGIHNNVLSTWYTAEAALECQVETFVLISTDKAVNPTNVMGATKRFAELTLQALQERSTSTRFCMVRFGNVLESSGSVVPLFREQIKRGGPVTVTHKEIIRYFMTIPEASQLVLQAGAMAQGGDVFVLDMGEPVRIVDLAKRMIHLMGLTVRDDANRDGDIEIVFTGLRPAEKLYEELLIGSNVSGTEHPMIMRASEPHLTWQQLSEILDEMHVALDAFDCDAARTLLLRTVQGYRPESGIQDLVWLRRIAERDGSNVTDLRAHRLRNRL